MKKIILICLLLTGCETMQVQPGFWRDVGQTYQGAVLAGYPRIVKPPPTLSCETVGMPPFQRTSCITY